MADDLATAARLVLTATPDTTETYWFTAWINDATRVCNHCLAPLEADPYGSAAPQFRAEEHLDTCTFRRLHAALAAVTRP